ncbi:MAG: rhodanese-related sulfurtransferase [Pseudomonadota bacterium]
MTDYRVAAFYKFTPLPDYESRKAALESALAETDVRGTILLAAEGVNGTIAGKNHEIGAALAALKQLPGCADLEWKESRAPEMPFFRLKVRLKKEIVTMGVPGVDPNVAVGNYVNPEDWNGMLDDPDTVVIDTRNDYEVSIGTFDGAVNPETASFRDFPEWFRKFRETNDKAKVAMFCTGGIRCEKATSFLKSEGIDEVFHLKGGILKYLETVPAEDSRWHGECFVFDQRVSVKHGLEPGDYDQCHACKHPVSADDMADPRYEPGLSCPRCHDTLTEDQKRRFAERQKQMQLAKARGETHIGAPLKETG